MNHTHVRQRAHFAPTKTTPPKTHPSSLFWQDGSEPHKRSAEKRERGIEGIKDKVTCLLSLCGFCCFLGNKLHTLRNVVSLPLRLSLARTKCIPVFFLTFQAQQPEATQLHSWSCEQEADSCFFHSQYLSKEADILCHCGIFAKFSTLIPKC